MLRNLLVVAALLLTNLTGVAAAAENPEQTSKKSKHARSTLVVLGEMGINSSEVNDLVGYIDQRVTKGRFNLVEERAMGGTLSLGYNFSNARYSPLRKSKGIELKFTPDNSRFEYIARPDAVLVNYRLKF